MPYAEAPAWVANWEKTGLIAWKDKNQDGVIQYRAGAAFEPAKPAFTGELGAHGERMISNQPTGIGAVGAMLNMLVAYGVSRVTAATPESVRELVDDIRIPAGAGVAHRH